MRKKLEVGDRVRVIALPPYGVDERIEVGDVGQIAEIRPLTAGIPQRPNPHPYGVKFEGDDGETVWGFFGARHLEVVGAEEAK